MPALIAIHSRTFPVPASLPLEAARRPAAAWPVRRQLTYITVAWMFGSIWFNVTQGAVMTMFLKGLGASPLQFGLMAAMPYVAQLLSVPGSLLVERTGNRKRIFLDCHLLQRSLTLVIAAAPVALLACYGPAGAGHAAALVLGLMFVLHAAGATGGPAWVSWMADVVPARVRGKYFAGRRQWGIVTAVPAALAIGWGMDRLCSSGGGSGGGAGSSAGGSPLAGVPAVVFWGAALLAASTFFGLMDIVLFAPVPHAARPPRAGRELLASFAAPLRDKRFLTLSTFVGALNFTVGFTNQFATLYVIDRLKVDHIHAQVMLLVTPMLVQWALLPAWGAAVDKMGQRPLLVLSGLGLIPMGFGWCLMGEGSAWLGYVLFAGGTALWTGVEVANFNAVIDASGRAAAPGTKPGMKPGVKPAGGSGYHAVNTVLVNAFGCAGGLAAGLIAAGVGGRTWQPVAWFRPGDFYDALFALSGAVRVLAVVAIVPLMADPAAKGVGATARFLVAFTAGRVGELAAAVGRRVRPVTAKPAEGEDGSDDGWDGPAPIGAIGLDAEPAEGRAAA
ncbi:MAG: major facilitator superfamily protein [Phycisphaerales bacterium]|nr:major facilitator superfamily protein [Phycisphaerales bacterium]